MRLRILAVALLATLGLLTSPTEVFAVIQSLNGQTGQTQIFTNDSNVTINSANDIHSILWSGQLPVSRGGTGNDAFLEGSVIFMGQNRFRQDNNNFFWDRINNRLGVGTSSPTSTLDVLGDLKLSNNLILWSQPNSGFIITPDATSINPDTVDLKISVSNAFGDGNGGNMLVQAGSGSGSGLGGEIVIRSGDGGANEGAGGNMSIDAGSGGINGGTGGDFDMTAGDGRGNNKGGRIHIFAGGGGIDGGDGGTVTIQGGTASGGNANGGDIILSAGASSGTGIKGTVRIKDPISFIQALFNTSFLATSDKTFTFPNFSGTFGLLEADQTWSGLNTFEASANSTIYVGSSVKSGCIALGDSDGKGQTKPSICQ